MQVQAALHRFLHQVEAFDGDMVMHRLHAARQARAQLFHPGILPAFHPPRTDSAEISCFVNSPRLYPQVPATTGNVLWHSGRAHSGVDCPMREAVQWLAWRAHAAEAIGP